MFENPNENEQSFEEEKNEFFERLTNLMLLQKMGIPFVVESDNTDNNNPHAVSDTPNDKPSSRC